MAQLFFRVMGPDNQAKFNDLVDTIAKAYGYRATIYDPAQGDIPNPQTKLDFISQTEKNRVLAVYSNQKRQDARDAASPIDPGLSN